MPWSWVLTSFGRPARLPHPAKAFGEKLPTSTFAIIVAAGAGVRMGGDVPKALMPLAGRPMLLWSLDAMRSSARIDGVVIVAPPGREDSVRALVAGPGGPVEIATGAGSRSESVAAGLRIVPGEAALVIVHDAARPLVSPALIGAVLDALADADGAIAAAPVVDTLKRGDRDGLIAQTVPREGLWAAQTPQGFRAASLRAAIAAADRAGSLAGATDCASILEAWGGRVRLVASAAPNPKVTTRMDVAVAEALLGGREPE
jgi:2-C-methyl-D-erythritol 4-phosphate cytidylyltransferase